MIPLLEPMLSDFKKWSVGWSVQCFIEDMAAPGMKPIGPSQMYILRKIQRATIGSKMATSLTKRDIIDWVKELRTKPGGHGSPISAATANQYVTYFSGALKYVGAVHEDCEITAAAVDAAKPFLVKHNLIGKSAPRDQRPTEEQRALLLKLAEERNARRNTKIDLVLMDRWQYAAGMRIGASCKILWRDWNPEDQTQVIRGMKDPRVRNKVKVVALRGIAQEMLFELAYAMNAAGPEAWKNQEPRIFPYHAKSTSQAHSILRDRAGLKGKLRLHDWRRECSSQLVEVEGYSAEEAIGFTGHETTAVFQRTYMKLKPEKLKDGPRSRRAA